ncbi:MAG: YvcK family protein [Patescibacteria group bacterium]|nr:YvcK family protein [Patescibacteria group bacterium]MDE1966137.1 YvcK family protein [Patescibacteria group bacterium]
MQRNQSKTSGERVRGSEDLNGLLSNRAPRAGSENGPKKIVTIGGGTGTFVVLSGLRKKGGAELSAIVSSADDGGSTGRLRDAYGSLPVGDARQALIALSADGTVLRDLFAFRFEKGDIAGHNLGNLFLTALTEILGNEAKAIREASRILRVSGYVIPATERSTTLVATLEDGTQVRGEHAIDIRDGARAKIRDMRLDEDAPLSEQARVAIREASLIVLGPGDLYASTVAALLPKGMKEAIAESPARLVYVMNLFTKKGQTNGYAASDFIQEIERYAGRAPDVILMNTDTFPKEVVEFYAAHDECPLADDLPRDDARVRRLPLASVHELAKLREGDDVPRSLVRHDPGRLADALDGIA